MDDLYIILLFIGIVVFLYWAFTFKSKSEKEYDKKIKESLEDEYIIDPETGAKLTLEEAESGHWVEHDNEFHTTPEPDIEKLHTAEQQEAEKAINYLKEKPEYRKKKLTPDQVDFIEQIKTLSKYDDWSYSNPFKIEYCNGFVFLPAVRLNGHSYYDNDYHESQIMFWIKLEIDLGHYYLREKSKTEKIFDLIRNDDDLKLNNYESFTFRKTDNLIVLINILKNFEGEKGLEIEFLDNNLFIKNTKLINTADILQIEKIVKNVY